MTKEHRLYLNKLKYRKIVIHTLRIGILLLLILFWELSARFEWSDPFITSSPSRIIKTIYELWNGGNLLRHLGTTLMETVIGFTLSTIIGSVVAIMLWFSETARRVVEPYLVVLNALPKVALGPLIIIWAGAGQKAIITMALLICVIITIISMLQGFLSVDAEKTDLIRSMGGNKFQVLIKLVIPANIPTFVSVLKINVGLSWVGTIMGEYLVSREGVGYLLVYGSQIFKLDLVMASTILLCIMASLMYIVVAAAEKIIKQYY